MCLRVSQTENLPQGVNMFFQTQRQLQPSLYVLRVRDISYIVIRLYFCLDAGTLLHFCLKAGTYLLTVVVMLPDLL
jgi:hypothetical protein